MREGLRRVSVALNVGGWAWLLGWSAYFLWEYFTLEPDSRTPPFGRVLIGSPGLLLCVVSWIVEGFAVPNRRKDPAP